MRRALLQQYFLAFLIERNALSADQVEHYAGMQQGLGLRLLEDGLILPEAYARFLSEFLGFSLAAEQTFLAENLSSPPLPLPPDMQFYQQDNSYQLVITDLEQIEYLELIQFKTEVNPEAFIAVISVNENTEIYQESGDDVIRLVDQLFDDAVRNQISDLHFESFAHQLRLRIRVDGLLHVYKEIKAELISRVISRIKVMAGLNIAVSNKPQDGRLSIDSKYGKKEARVNICPTLWGEKIVVRFLQDESKLFNLNELGFSDQQYQLIKSALAKPQGMILVTGPTGSGKSATLYAALNYLNNNERNIVTIEDPIEIKIFGINQTAVNRAAEFGFSEALRAFLRQDPDVMMVGEMRDFETADLAMKAAQTGHLMLSTLHTNNAVETLNRLLHMGVAPINLSSSIHLIIAQRLVRKLCGFCKQKQIINGEIIYKPKGCERCYQGYKGRAAIFEFIPLAQLVENSAEIIRDHQQLIALARVGAKDNLKTSMQSLIKNGISSVEEMWRVI